MTSIRQTPEITKGLPNLTTGNHSVESPPSRKYNCIAWATGQDAIQLWPDSEDHDWPAGVLNKQRVKAFIELFALMGYERCKDGTHEPGFEKIAIYAKGNTPTHAARQLNNGHWASKLGDEEDIYHDDPSVVAGGEYGVVAIYMRRRDTPAPPVSTTTSATTSRKSNAPDSVA